MRKYNLFWLLYEKQPFSVVMAAKDNPQPRLMEIADRE